MLCSSSKVEAKVLFAIFDLRVIDLVFYINSPSVLLFRLISINVSSMLIMFHLFIFQDFLCIPTFRTCFVCLYFLQWLVKTYICHVNETDYSSWQPSCPSSLILISLVATYICLLGQRLEVLNSINSTILVKMFWIFTTFQGTNDSKRFQQAGLNFVWR